MAAVTNDEQAALKEVMQMLETTPDSSTPSNQREKLAVLISTGKSKEAIGVQLTYEQVRRLTDEEVSKFYKRYEAYVGNKTTETLMDSFLMLVSKGVGMLVSTDDVKELQKDLKNDYIINQEFSSTADSLSLRCGRLLAVANTALITAKHIDFENNNNNTTNNNTNNKGMEPDIVEHTNKNREGTMYPSRDSEGYPLEGFDEIDELFHE